MGWSSPVLAKTLTTPPGVIFSIALSLSMTAYRLPAESIARPLGAFSPVLAKVVGPPPAVL